MRTTPIMRATAMAAAITASAFGSAGQAAAEPGTFYDHTLRIYTVAQQPERCLGGTVDIAVSRYDLYPGRMEADFTTHMYNPAWTGSASYECYVTLTADWRNHATGQAGSISSEQASWRFMGSYVSPSRIFIDVGEGPVTVSFRTNMPHFPNPTLEVPAV